MFWINPNKPKPDPKPVDLDLDMNFLCETRLDLYMDLDFKNNLDLNISDVKTDLTRCHPYYIWLLTSCSKRFLEHLQRC